MKITLNEIATWIPESQKYGDATIRGISTDSRTVQKGNLFVALKGESFDAHDFLEDVIQKGAAAILVERAPKATNVPMIVVKDSKKALGDIAFHWRKRFSLPIIAVTGSNGKTTVKGMIASILEAAYGKNYLATLGNLNNEIGVPQTLYRMSEDQKAAVVELGMNHPGEIQYLAKLTQPTVALVNNAQREHQEFMETVLAVAKENGNVIRALPAHGVAVFPEDDEFTDLWKSYTQEEPTRRYVTFGLNQSATINGTYDKGILKTRLKGKEQTIRLQVLGKHNAKNALAAMACCDAIGVSADDIVKGLESFEAVNGRLQRKTASNGALVIDDTYNANPDSVRVAIDVLSPIKEKTILVLGDMGEVGDQGEAFHREVGIYAKEKQIDHLLTLGSLTRFTSEGFGHETNHYDDVNELIKELKKMVSPSSVVLVKGSRFMKMERVVNALIGS